MPIHDGFHTMTNAQPTVPVDTAAARSDPWGGQAGTGTVVSGNLMRPVSTPGAKSCAIA